MERFEWIEERELLAFRACTRTAEHELSEKCWLCSLAAFLLRFRFSRLNGFSSSSSGLYEATMLPPGYGPNAKRLFGPSRIYDCFLDSGSSS